MIRYALTCDKGHAFESWFQSAEAFDRLRPPAWPPAPIAARPRSAKALMAPQVRPARTAEARAEAVPRRAAAAGPASAANAAPAASGQPPGPLSAPATEREKALAELRRRVEENSEYVGMSFAAEARAMHDGEAPERSIWGEARPDEARQLIEDGVPVAPLPFRPRAKSN